MSQPPSLAEASGVTSAVAVTARLIGVTSAVQDLTAVRPSAPAGSPPHWRELWLRTFIYERVMVASLETDATIATIDNEIAHCTELRGYLADRRDRNVIRANLLSALLGGGLGGTSAGLQLSSKQTNATAATGMAGGAISAGLGLYGIRAQRGGTRTLDAASNMLAEFFNRPELPTSHYPHVIWEFLNEVAPDEPDHLVRRQRLIRTWLEVDRVDSLDSPSGKTKIQHVTSVPSEHLQLTIDDLEDRIAMLQDVRAKVSYLKRDLAALLASLPDLNTPAKGQ